MFNKNGLSLASFAHQRAWISPSLIPLMEGVHSNITEKKLLGIANFLRTVNYRSKA